MTRSTSSAWPSSARPRHAAPKAGSSSAAACRRGRSAAPRRKGRGNCRAWCCASASRLTLWKTSSSASSGATSGAVIGVVGMTSSAPAKLRLEIRDKALRVRAGSTARRSPHIFLPSMHALDDAAVDHRRPYRCRRCRDIRCRPRPPSACRSLAFISRTSSSTPTARAAPSTPALRQRLQRALRNSRPRPARPRRRRRSRRTTTVSDAEVGAAARRLCTAPRSAMSSRMQSSTERASGPIVS